jgi:hypothetical protein
MLWNGDGGSVGLGHVYLSAEIIELCRAGKRIEAIEAFLRQHKAGVLRRFYKEAFSAALSNVPIDGIRRELEDIRCDDPGRGFHLFLMLNDQRRHLTYMFRHQFYSRLLTYFPTTVTEVPWQTYPGHEPCPLEFDRRLSYQWDERALTDGDNWRRRDLLQQARRILKADRFPSTIANRRYLQLATWAYSVGLGDYSYVVKVANIYQKYWTMCGGRVAHL